MLNALSLQTIKNQKAGYIDLQSKITLIVRYACIKSFLEQSRALQVSLYYCYDTQCAVNTKELLRNLWNYNCLKIGPKIRNFKNQALR